MKAQKVPTYGLHKPTGQARVYINGKSHYLGKYGSEESRKLYGDLVGKLLSGQTIDPFARTKQPADQSSESGLTISELVLAFMRHAEGHYVKNGKPTSEIHCLKSATRPLIELYAFTTVDGFGPLMLKAVREKMVAAGWCRSVINKNVGRIRSIFRWGVENEMVSAVTLQRLQAVSPLLSGRTEAQDNPAKAPATEEQVQAVRKHVSPLVRDLIDVQRLTGARAGELLLMTPAKIDRSKNVWLYDVDGHKTAHHGHRRIRERFGVELDEDNLNASHQIILVAAELDDSTERIIKYLNAREIAINVVFFQVFQYGNDKLLSRAWMIDPGETQANVTVTTRVKGEKEPWNGEFYVSFGGDCTWEDARTYGFISAGGGTWYVQTLKLLNPGDRIWIKIPGSGYAGVGIVSESVQSVQDFTVNVKGKDQRALDVLSTKDKLRELADDPEKCEHFVRIKWLDTVPQEEAVRSVGFFGNQNTVCQPSSPKWRHTIERLKTHFPKWNSRACRHFGKTIGVEC